jgi:hypothetical protein
LKDFLGDTYFEKGWESVDRNFRKLSEASGDSGRVASGELSNALDKLSGQVELFADMWLHFHMRIEALMREYNISPADGAAREEVGAGRS